ncbi:hypothetical protein QQX98_007180 [Neonectria punicea]|uniref:N-acetyltransferase domain-containing protein n=1 Tax=Neonectria punicea TaxID=979145 RepID=A0ABR1GYX8_9HYPO
MASSSTVLPVTSSDLLTLAGFLYASKLSLTINRLIYKDWPAEAVQKRNYAKSIETSFNDSSDECLKAVDDVSGEILGFVVLTKKHPIDTEDLSSEKAREEKRVPIEDLDPELFHAASGGGD